MAAKRIDDLLNRLQALRGGLVRVFYADGGTVDVEPSEAIPFVMGDRPVVHIEAMGDMSGHGHLLELLNALCEV